MDIDLPQAPPRFLVDIGGMCSGAEWIASPNCDERPDDARVELLVVHSISLPPGEFGGPWVTDLFLNRLHPGADPYFAGLAGVRVSSHFLVDRDGRVIQYVPCELRAWHAGKSSWKGRERCNDFSVGIELEGTDYLPFTDAQYASLRELTRALFARYGRLDLAGHSDIAPGRKTDPGPRFDWARYRAGIPADPAVDPMLHRNPIVAQPGVDCAPMNLFDAPAGFDDPIGMWMGCHRRIEKQLNTLSKLPAHLADKGVDAEASTAAQAILRYFEKSAGHHHEDEDRDLFPLLEKRISDAGDLARFRALRRQLESDHERMAACWARLRKPLQGIAEGIPRPLDTAEVATFRGIYATHIPAEDGAIPDLARRYFTAADLESLGRSMAARRGVEFSA